MQDREIRILAVNPGSRYVGIAVFHGPELVDWAIKLTGNKSKKGKSDRLRSLLMEATERHTVNCLAIKKFHPARSSRCLNRLTNEVKDWASKSGLIVREYTVKEIEGSLLPTEKGNKKRLMEEIAARYPFLYPEFQKEMRNRNPYRIRMFEAVALGMRCLGDLENPKGRKSIGYNHEEE